MIWSYYFIPSSVGALAAMMFLLWTHLFSGSVVLSMELTEYGLEGICLLFSLDKYSFVFMLMTLVVSSNILVYSMPYMTKDPRKKGFIKVLCVFICSMILLSFSSSLFTAMIGWDMLGVSSFALILYYQNWSSFNSSMITFLTNRLGDVAILISLVMTFMSGQLDWAWVVKDSSSTTILFLLGSVTKSAQFPFSAWLPRAMAAPTPVSALVHSSTLVTAGVYMVVRFFPWLSSGDLSILWVMGVLSILMAGISSLGEYDIKKIIALSTLSHISLMILSVSIGAISTAMTHMFVHAMFKSSLFMVAGWLIHCSNGEQDIRRLSISSLSESGKTLLLFSLMSMSGFPFMSGFFSKEEILSSVMEKGETTSMVVFFLGAMMTGSYSVRLMYSLSKSSQIHTFQGVGSSKVIDILFTQSSIMVAVVSGAAIPFIQTQEQGNNMSLFSSVSKTTLFVFMMYGIWVGVWSLGGKYLIPYWPIRTLSYMWSIGALSDFFNILTARTSWSFLFFMDVKGLIDTPLYKGGVVSWWNSYSVRLSHLNPSVWYEMFLILSLSMVLFV